MSPPPPPQRPADATAGASEAAAQPSSAGAPAPHDPHHAIGPSPDPNPDSGPGPGRDPDSDSGFHSDSDSGGATDTGIATGFDADIDPEPGYRGPAVLEVEGRERTVEVWLRGTFQPVDGRYHWYGRVVGAPELAGLLGGRRAAARIRTPQGEASGELSEPDPWNRYRVTGVSTPPFHVPGPPGVSGLPASPGGSGPSAPSGVSGLPVSPGVSGPSASPAPSEGADPPATA
ncbi:DUF4873 domain-containing protein [Streptomyces sp. NPDC057702]|uniref:DUF4873 domain-containing protein n=1 Tax=unclassified Streptomyces TaxID=2593676 RepID=UPI0036D018A7